MTTTSGTTCAREDGRRIDLRPITVPIRESFVSRLALKFGAHSFFERHR
jgi:hypothetical protein